MSHYTYPPPVPYPPVFPYGYSSVDNGAPLPQAMPAPQAPMAPLIHDDVLRQYIDDAIQRAVAEHRSSSAQLFVHLNAQYAASTEARMREMEAKMLAMETRMREAGLRLADMPSEMMKVNIDKHLDDMLKTKVAEVESRWHQEADARISADEEQLRNHLKSAREQQALDLDEALKAKVAEVENWFYQQADARISAAGERIRDSLKVAGGQVLIIGEKGEEEMGQHVFNLGLEIGRETRSLAEDVEKRLTAKISALREAQVAIVKETRSLVGDVETRLRSEISALKLHVDKRKHTQGDTEALLACQRLDIEMEALRDNLEARMDLLDIYFSQRLGAVLSQLASSSRKTNSGSTPDGKESTPEDTTPTTNSADSPADGGLGALEHRFTVALSDLKHELEDRLQGLSARCVKLERSVRKVTQIRPRDNRCRGDGLVRQYDEIPALDGTFPSEWVFEDLPFPPLRHISDIDRLSEEQLVYALQRYGCDCIPYSYAERKRLLLREIGSSLA